MGVVWVVEFTGIKLKYPRWVAGYVIVHLPDLMLLLLACSGTIWDNEFSLVYKKNFALSTFLNHIWHDLLKGTLKHKV